MLTQTLRRLERDGLIARRVKAAVPPQVSYRLTPQGEALSEATCGIWHWVEKNIKHVEKSREAFDLRKRDAGREEDLHDLRVMDERKNEKTVSLSEVKRRLKKEGRL
jgi:DNA-binding PadR family transcriptional regulator